MTHFDKIKSSETIEELFDRLRYNYTTNVVVLMYMCNGEKMAYFECVPILFSDKKGSIKKLKEIMDKENFIGWCSCKEFDQYIKDNHMSLINRS